MLQRKWTRIAIAVVSVLVIVLPASAMAKKAAKPLTKAQVVALIKQYAGQGPAGAAGKDGAAGKEGAAGAAGNAGAALPAGAFASGASSRVSTSPG